MTSEGLRSAFRGTIALVIAVLVLHGDGGTSPVTLTVLCFALLYVAASTVAEWRSTAAPDHPYADIARAFGDLIALCAVIVAVDHPPSELLLFLCAVPLGHALSLQPTAIAILTVAAIAGAFGIWATGIAVHPEPVSNADLLITSFGLVWAGLVSCLIAIERDRRANRIRELSMTLQDLLSQVITAEETERRRVADLLHDDVLQLLLVTRHDVADALEGDDDALPRAAVGLDLATQHLRQTLGGLRSEGVASRQLGDGLSVLGAQTAERRGCEVTVDVAARLGLGHHPLVLSLGRDLLREIERRSTATQIIVRAFPRDLDIVLTIRHDDPRRTGLGPDDDRSDLLTAVDQRASAVGGSFAVNRFGDGTRILTVVVPFRPPASLSPPATAPRRRRMRVTAAFPDHPPAAPLGAQPDADAG